MKIIIDTNIYLNFFRRSDQSLVLLDLLISFVESDKFKILLPRQIEDEFWRRKQEVVSEHILELEKGLEVKIPLPLFLESFKKSKDLKKAAKKFNSLKKEVISEYKKRAFNPNSGINKKINKLFSLSIRIEESKEILEKAHFRTLKGNPPRKNNSSFGDAIIWETILWEYVDDDLIIISGDGDYSEKYNSAELHGFLKREWNSKSKKTIKLYTNLGFFVNEKSGKKKPIKKETIQEEDYLNVFASQINAIHSNPSFSSMRDIGVSNIFGSASVGVVDNLSLSMLHNSICSSCHNSFEYSPTTVGPNDKCPDCKNKVFAGIDTLAIGFKKCSECGESYFEDSILSITSKNKCSKCQNKDYSIT